MVHVERVDEVVDLRRVLRRRERRLAGKIHGFRIGTEIMIKRNVFLEDHDNMLDRRRGASIVGITAVPIVGDGACSCDREGQSGHKS